MLDCRGVGLANRMSVVVFVKNPLQLWMQFVVAKFTACEEKYWLGRSEVLELTAQCDLYRFACMQ